MLSKHDFVSSQLTVRLSSNQLNDLFTDDAPEEKFLVLPVFSDTNGLPSPIIHPKCKQGEIPKLH